MGVDKQTKYLTKDTRCREQTGRARWASYVHTS